MRRLQSLLAGLPGGELHHDGAGRYRPRSAKLGGKDRILAMNTLIQNGTVVTSTSTTKADVLIDGETVREVRAGIPAAGAKVIDATGLYVIPGGIDCHTHLDMPFGGTTALVDFAIQARGTRMRDALDTWWKKAEGRACIDYGLHMIVTDLGQCGLEDMDDMVNEGVA